VLGLCARHREARSASLSPLGGLDALLTSHDEVEPVKVVVAGAGIAGLACGIALERAGHDVALYERVDQVRHVGAGISVWPNGVMALDRLGLGPAVEAAGGRMDAMAYADARGARLCRFSLEPLYQRVGRRAFPLPRAILHGLLLGQLASPVHWGTACLGVTERPGGACVELTGEEVVEADLLVAADGTHSRLRRRVVPGAAERRYVGYVNWNGLVASSAADAPANMWITYVGQARRVSLMPVGPDLSYFFFDVPGPPDGPEPDDAREALSGYFEGWGPPVRQLLAALDPERVNRVAIHDTEPLSTFHSQRIVLVGDAAHTTAPDLGQGGCLALEDAVVLGQVLPQTARSDPGELPAALDRFDQARVGRCAEIIRRARKRSDVTHGAAPDVTEAWYKELATETGDRVLAGIAQTVEHGPFR
jgi:FAD-dependent urate hydroxylase